MTAPVSLLELSRIEVGRIAEVLEILRAPHASAREAAKAYEIPGAAFARLLARPAAVTVQSAAVDAIAAAVRVSRTELLAGRALAAARLAAVPVADGREAGTR
jgi:hypothetical protein